MAAEPVSPDVATTIVRRSPRRAQLGVHEPADELEGDVLEGERRAVEQLLHPDAVAELDERHDVGVVEDGVGVVDDGRRSRRTPST